MKYTVTDVTTSHILVKFENGSLAHVKIESGWDKEKIEEEISKYIPKEKNDDNSFSSLDEVPIKIGDSNDIESYASVMQRKADKQNKEREEELIKLESDRKEFERVIAEKERNRPVDYKERRRKEFPSIEEQLDSLYHAGIFPDDMSSRIREIKEKYPKDMPVAKAVDVYPSLREDEIKVVIDGVEVSVPASLVEE